METLLCDEVCYRVPHCLQFKNRFASTVACAKVSEYCKNLGDIAEFEAQRFSAEHGLS